MALEKTAAASQTPTPDPGPVRTVIATRYVTPLREGGSLPAIVETDVSGGGQTAEGGAPRLFVVKFRGAGQGARALVAELISARIAQALALPVPEPVIVQLDAAIGRTEPDQEVGELLRASAGLNFGLGYLAGAVTFTRGADPPPDAGLASGIVWLDAYLMNVDRTVRNPNLLVQQARLWLIDHGAALYWHHDWQADTDRSGDRFARVRDHVLLPFASELAALAPTLAARITDAQIDAALAALPDEWLSTPGQPHLSTPTAHRAGYRAFLRQRRDGAGGFVQEALDARGKLV